MVVSASPFESVVVGVVVEVVGVAVVVEVVGVDCGWSGGACY